MKHLIAGIMLSLAPIVHAEESVAITFPAYCITINTLAELTSEYDELPYIRATSSRNVDGGLMDNSLVIFINMETKTYTITERINKEYFCVIATGEEFEPVESKIRNDIMKHRRKPQL